MKALFKYLACALIVLSLARHEPAEAVESSLMLHFGEAFGPSNVRFDYKDVDIGYDWGGGGLYFGKRLWKENVYGSFGPWVTFQDLGFYGTLGRRWKFSGVFALSAEFWTMGTVQGTTTAIVNLGIGARW